MCETVRRITPTQEELMASTSEVIHNCPHCEYSTPNSSRLRAHLVKRHRIIQTEEDYAFYSKGNTSLSTLKVYYCPVASCKYHLEGGKGGFPKLNALKQHFMWCHLAKQHSCQHCTSMFPTRRHLLVHEKHCNYNSTNHMQLQCQRCKKVFSRRNTLSKHLASVCREYATQQERVPLPLMLSPPSTTVLPTLYLPIVPVLGPFPVNVSTSSGFTLPNSDALRQAVMSAFTSSFSNRTEAATQTDVVGIPPIHLANQFFVSEGIGKDSPSICDQRLQFNTEESFPPGASSSMWSTSNARISTASMQVQHLEPTPSTGEIGVATDLCFGLDCLFLTPRDVLESLNGNAAGACCKATGLESASTAIQTDVGGFPGGTFGLEHFTAATVETQTMSGPEMLDRSMAHPAGVTDGLHTPSYCETMFPSAWNDMETQTMETGFNLEDIFTDFHTVSATTQTRNWPDYHSPINNSHNTTV